MNRRTSGFLSIGAASTIWGTLPVIVQHADAPPAVLVAMRMGFGALSLGAGLAASWIRSRQALHRRGPRRAAFRVTRRDRAPSADATPQEPSQPLEVRWSQRLLPEAGRGRRSGVAGASGLGALLAVTWVLFFAALKSLPGATATLVNYVFPILVAIAAPMLVRERRQRHVLACAVAGFAGIAVILGPQAQAGRASGVGFALVAAVTSAALLIGARAVVAGGMRGTVVAFVEYATGAVLLSPFAAGRVHSSAWAWGVLIGLVHTGLAGWLFFRGVERLSAQEVGVLMYLEPVAAVSFVWIVSARSPGWAGAVGGLLVVGAGAGIVLLSSDDSRR